LLSGHTIVLTGIGREGQVGEVVARELANRGATLILVDHRQETVDARLRALRQSPDAQRLAPDAYGYACDLSSSDEVARLANAIRESHPGGVNALVHMAGGFAMSGPVADSALDVWDRQLSINLRTAYLTSRGLLPLLRPTRGSIVFFSSQAALPGSTVAEMSAYAIAKTGVAVLARAIAAEERRHGVRANALAPSTIRTAANVEAMGEQARYVEREDVAAAVAFLCSAAATAISGQVIALA
jgi:NAD(P)-dependent dehydrogenase (short-subunit alcohol dehydrogenase family)